MRERATRGRVASCAIAPVVVMSGLQFLLGWLAYSEIIAQLWFAFLYVGERFGREFPRAVIALACG